MIVSYLGLGTQRIRLQKKIDIAVGFVLCLCQITSGSSGRMSFKTVTKVNGCRLSQVMWAHFLNTDGPHHMWVAHTMNYRA